MGGNQVAFPIFSLKHTQSHCILTNLVVGQLLENWNGEVFGMIKTV